MPHGSSNWLFNMAVKIGTRYNETQAGQQTVPWWLGLGYHLAHFVVFRKLKKRLGFDRVRIGFSGAAPISHEILKFFQSIGIPIREGYGMTETTGITHMSDESSFKVGTVGKALPGTEVRSPKTARSWSSIRAFSKGITRTRRIPGRPCVDGWMHTGDVGRSTTKGS